MFSKVIKRCYGVKVSRILEPAFSAPKSPSWSIKDFIPEQTKPTAEITRERILKTCQLARIAVTEEECKKLEEDLRHILQCEELIQEVDTQNVEPMYSPLQEGYNCMDNARDDEVTDGNRLQDIIGQPDVKTKSKFFVVPKVVGESIE